LIALIFKITNENSDMKKLGVWNVGEDFHGPHYHQSVSKLDVCIDFLERKICPIHLSPLIYHEEFTPPGGDYQRSHYICVNCRCKAEFVGEELKSDSVLRTMDTIAAMEAEAKEMAESRVMSDTSTKGSLSF